MNTTVNVQAAVTGSTKQEVDYKVALTNTGGAAIDKLRARIFVDLSEVFKAGYTDSDVTIEGSYDQSNMTKLAGPIVWDADNKIYYFEIDWNSFVLKEAATIEMNFRIRTKNWQSCLDYLNDYSSTDLIETVTDTKYIPLYHGNLIMCGKEPLVGVIVQPIVYGDVNNDGIVNVSDCLLMKKNILGQLTDFPVDNDIKVADVNGDKLINIIDYINMKKFIVGSISKFPVDK